MPHFRGLHKAPLPSPAVTGKGEAGSAQPVCDTQPKSQSPHSFLASKKAVKKAWRKQAWQPFHTPPANIHVVFLYCFWSFCGVWPFLPSYCGYRSNLHCWPLLWVRFIFKVLLNSTRQYASYINYDGFTIIPCDVLWETWSLAFLFSPTLDY